jgi:hypothetical protein
LVTVGHTRSPLGKEFHSGVEITWNTSDCALQPPKETRTLYFPGTWALKMAEVAPGMATPALSSHWNFTPVAVQNKESP